MTKTKIDGIDYSPAGIEALRDDLIVYRNRALDAMPEGAQMAVVLSHTIALLAYLKELVIGGVKLAELVKVRHRCECDTATEPPGEDGIEHVFEIDGAEFPWYIAEGGPRIRKLGDRLYAVTVEIFCEQVDVIGIEVTE